MSLFIPIFIFFLSFIFLYRFSFFVKLIDFPNSRKIHHKPIPLIGGLLIAFSLLSYIFFFNQNIFYNIVFYPSLIIVIIGLIDDFLNINYIYRFLVQFFVSSIIIFSGFYIKGIGDYGYFNADNLYIIGIILTYLSILAITNAINFSDGIDGLSSSLIFNSIITLFVFTFISGTYHTDFFLIIFAIILFIFIFFNLGIFNRYKIFLGDSGSTLIGFLFGWILIYYASPVNNFIHPVLAIWCITLPLYDLSNVIINRISNNKNPFKPDMSHMHHLLLKLLKSQTKTLFLLICFSLMLNSIGGLVYFYFNPLISLIAFIFFFFLYFLLYRFIINIDLINNK